MRLTCLLNVSHARLALVLFCECGRPGAKLVLQGPELMQQGLKMLQHLHAQRPGLVRLVTTVSIHPMIMPTRTASWSMCQDWQTADSSPLDAQRHASQGEKLLCGDKQHPPGACTKA